MAMTAALEQAWPGPLPVTEIVPIADLAAEIALRVRRELISVNGGRQPLHTGVQAVLDALDARYRPAGSRAVVRLAEPATSILKGMAEHPSSAGVALEQRISAALKHAMGLRGDQSAAITVTRTD